MKQDNGKVSAGKVNSTHNTGVETRASLELKTQIVRSIAVAEEEPIAFYIGIDIGDRKSNYCVLDQAGEIRAEGVLKTTIADFTACFSDLGRCRIGFEVGTHSPWVSELLIDLGHEVYVGNPRKIESIHKSKKKNDREDARKLGRLVRVDPKLLSPIRHRGLSARADLITLRAREAAVDARTQLVNCVRGLVKSVGGRIPSCSAESFHKHAASALPEIIREAMLLLVKQIEELTSVIKEYDKAVQKKTKENYPETEQLQQVCGVGALTSLAFILTLEKAEHFRKSREVGPYLGFVPKQDDSGKSSKQLGITKTGDVLLRRLLVNSSQYILGPFGPDCDLRRFGLKLAQRGGKNAKKRAIIAVARKLAILLHRLWVSGEVYDPLRNARLQEEAIAAAV